MHCCLYSSLSAALPATLVSRLMSHQLAWLSFSTWHLTWEREPTSSCKSQHILTLAVSCPGSRVQSWDPGLLKQLLLPEAMQLEVVMQRTGESFFW